MFLICNCFIYQVGEDGSDTDWNMTVRLPEGLPEDFDYSEPVNVVDGEKMTMTMIVMMMMTMMVMIMMMVMMMMTITILPSGECSGGQEGK